MTGWSRSPVGPPHIPLFLLSHLCAPHLSFPPADRQPPCLYAPSLRVAFRHASGVPSLSLDYVAPWIRSLHWSPAALPAPPPPACGSPFACRVPLSHYPSPAQPERRKVPSLRVSRRLCLLLHLPQLFFSLPLLEHTHSPSCLTRATSGCIPALVKVRCILSLSPTPWSSAPNSDDRPSCVVVFCHLPPSYAWQKWCQCRCPPFAVCNAVVNYPPSPRIARSLINLSRCPLSPSLSHARQKLLSGCIPST